MKRRMAILGLMTLAAAPPADAQNNAAAQAARRAMEERLSGRQQQGQQQQQQAPGEWSAAGVIHSVSRGTINIITDQQQPWRVTVAQQAKVTVKGEGGPELIKPRALVSFFADINPEGSATKPIAELRLLAPSREFKPDARAVTPEEEQEIKAKEWGEKPDPRQRRVRRPASTRESAQDQADQAEEGADRARGDEQQPPSKRYFIKGAVKNVRHNEIVVDVGRGRMTGELAEGAKVKAEFDSLAAASPGDRIEVTGVPAPFDPRNQFGQAIAQSITVTLTPPPEDPSQRRRGARRASRNDESPGDEPADQGQRDGDRRGR